MIRQSIALALAAMLIGSHVMAAKSDELTGQATLDIFSGRPNPTWMLTAAETQELRTRIAGLPREGSAAPEPPDLGYRGVHVAMERVEVRIGHGGIVVEEGGSTENFADAGRLLERWLLQTARGKVAPDVLKIAEADVGAAP